MEKTGKNIYRRKDGRFEGRFIKGRKESGKLSYGYVYGSTYREAENKLMLSQIKPAIQPEPEDVTLSQWLDRWLGIAKIFITTQAHSRYGTVITTYIAPVLGMYRLLAVDSEDINNFINGSRLPKITRMDIVAILKSAMKLAEIEFGLIGVADSIEAVTWVKNKERTLTEEEQKHLTASSLHRGDKLDTGILLALYAGLRGGELCALKWRDLDLENGIVHITKSVRRVNNPDQNGETRTTVIIDTPEFKSAVREVPIPMFLMKYFSNQRYSHLPSVYILTGQQDKYMERRSVEYHLGKRMKSIGLEGINFRTLRDTFEIRCIEAGLDLQVVNVILGRKISTRISADLPLPTIKQKRDSIEKLAKSQKALSSREVRLG